MKHEFGYNIHSAQGQKNLEHDGLIIGTIAMLGSIVTAISGDGVTASMLLASGLGVSFLSHLNRGLRRKTSSTLEEQRNTGGDEL
jgi:hypothetical protein